MGVFSTFFTCLCGLIMFCFQTMMVDLVHYMGGGIRKDFSAKVTHLVAMRSGGEKYRVSCSFIITFALL